MRPRAGPSLPQSILEEIVTAEGKSRSRRGVHSKLSRKEARKQERAQKKQRKADNFSNARVQNNKRPSTGEHVSSPPSKKARLSESDNSKVKEKASNLRSASKPSQEGHRNVSVSSSKIGTSKSALQKLAERTTGSVTSSRGSAKGKEQALSLPRTRQEEEEDAYIAYMEKKLGWSKGGSKTSKYGKELEEDGLDDLLQDLDNIEASLFDNTQVHEEQETKGDLEESNEEEEWSDEISDEELEGDDVSEDGDDSSDDEREVGEEVRVEWTGFGDFEEETAEEGDAPTTQYLTDSTTRYFPPHLRNKQVETAQVSEAQIKLTRQLKGLINRMSEQNLSSILNSIEEIYQNHRRYDVTSTLTTILIDGISSNAMLLDSYVVLHAAFVASLYKLVGIEFAAYFVQTVVSQYEQHFTRLQVPEHAAESVAKGGVIGKECLNLIVLLSELYNFQVISCTLVYDIIRMLLDGDLTEFKVELLLKITRSSGQQLRTDDPLALKDIIQLVHPKVETQKDTLSSRTRFMVETLTNLKNNKIKKSAAQAAGNDNVERMKKFLSGLGKKRHVRSHEPLRVTLEDLHSAESKGKWWLIGAAWGGDPLVDRRQQPQEPAKETESAANVLLKLAKKQGMNTDIRRSIFVILMSSEDYMDACERLSQLKLTEVQQREIIRVILHCCGNEKLYNPYYAFVVQQLCRFSHSYRITLQFCLWDFMRDLGQIDVGGAEVIKNLQDESAGFELGKISSTRMRNVARAYAWWIAKDCCTLLILKPVDFAVLKPQTRDFMKELFTHILVNTQRPTPLLSSNPDDYPTTRNRGPLEEVFIKASKVQAVALGLVYYVGKTFLHDEDVSKTFLTWAAKVAIDTLRAGVDIAGGL